MFAEGMEEGGGGLDKGVRKVDSVESSTTGKNTFRRAN